MQTHLPGLVLLAALALLSCKKENIAAGAGASQFGLETATVTATGSLQFSDEKTTGATAKVYQRKDGSLVLGIEQLTYKPITSTVVFLSSEPTVNSSAVKVYSATDYCGDVYVVLAPGLNPAALHWVVFQPTGQPPVATARLQ